MWKKEMVCPICGESFLPKRWTQVCCSPECQRKRRVKKQVTRISQKVKSDKAFHHKTIQQSVAGRRKFLGFWHEGLLHERNYNSRLLAQDFTCSELAKLGYVDIFNTRGVIYGSVLDIFAYKGGDLYGFLVTTRGCQVKVNPGVLAFAKYFKLRQVFIVWVRPNLEWYTIVPLQKGKENYYLKRGLVPGWSK